MFSVSDGRRAFYQWDTGQYLLCDGVTADTEVHFYMPKAAENALVLLAYEADGEVRVNVPNLLLQRSGDMMAYLYIGDEDEGKTVCAKPFRIIPRPKPDGYVYTETETLTWAALDARITELEKGGVNEDAIAAAVEAYMAEHPVVESDPTVPAWAKAETKPTYTAKEVGALPSDTEIPTDDHINELINTALGVIENGAY